MKQLILSAALLMTIGVNAGSSTFPENEKVVATFSRVFKNANHVVWSQKGNFYYAFFVVASVTVRARLDKKGNLVRIIRYYKEDNLPANILCRIKNDYPNKEIWGITEETIADDINYRIVLRDEKNYIHMGVNNRGEITILAKYNRSDG